MSSWLDILDSGNHSYDTALSGLSSITTKLALDELATLVGEVQELEVSVNPVTTADLTCVAHKHYVCDVSGMTAERNAILPVPAISQRLRITVSTGDDTYELVVKGAATVTINGGTAATEWSRLFMDGETVEFVGTSTTNWQVVHDGRIPQKAVLSEDTATQQLTATTETAVTLPDTDLNRGMTVASNTVTPRRSGRFKAHFHSNWTMTGLDADTVYAAITVNSVKVLTGPITTHEAPGSVDYAGAHVAGEFDWDTGDGAIGALMRIVGAVSPWPTVSVATGHPPQLIVEEDLTSIGAGVVTINISDGGGGASLALTSVAPTAADVTAERGKHYVVDASGMTADRTFLLPAPLAAGERIRVTLETADDTYALLIKASATSIQGGTAGVEWSRLVVDNEAVEFVSNSTSNWLVVYDGRIPLKGAYTEDTSTQTLGTAGEEAVVLSDIDLNRGMTMSAGTITPRRTGRYKVNFHSNWAKDTLDAQMVYAAAFVSTTKVLQSPMVTHDATNAVDNAGAQVIGEVDWTLGDGDFNVKARAEGGASPWPTLVVSPQPQFIVEEDLKTAGGSVIAGAGGGGASYPEGYAFLQAVPLTISGTTTVTATLKGQAKLDIEGTICTETGDVSTSGTAVSGTDVYAIYAENDGSDGISLTLETSVPIWSDTYGYWHKTGDTGRRYLGPVIVVSGSAAVTGDQIYRTAGDRSIVHYGFHIVLVTDNTASNDDWYLVDLADLAPPSIFEVYLGFSLYSDTSNDDSGLGLSDRDQGTDGWHAGQFYGRAYAQASASSAVNTGTLYVSSPAIYYRTADATTNISIVLKRSTYRI